MHKVIINQFYSSTTQQTKHYIYLIFYVLILLYFILHIYLFQILNMLVFNCKCMIFVLYIRYHPLWNNYKC